MPKVRKPYTLIAAQDLVVQAILPKGERRALRRMFASLAEGTRGEDLVREAMEEITVDNAAPGADPDWFGDCLAACVVTACEAAHIGTTDGGSN